MIYENILKDGVKELLKFNDIYKFFFLFRRVMIILNLYSFEKLG